MVSIEGEKKESMNKARLSIWLDTYDDIFSDFDSRPFSDRALSDDFIHEAKKIAMEKPGNKIELRLLMPEAIRNTENEKIIIKSLHTHFHQLAHAYANEKKKINRRGYALTAGGFILMILALVVSELATKSFLFNSIRVILEPASWFLVWTGLDHILYMARKQKPEYEFNSRMAHAEIAFHSS